MSAPLPRDFPAEGYLRRHAVWALVSLAYLYVFPYFDRLNNPNENVRVYMTRALVEHQTLAINKVEAEWGWVNDKAVHGGRLYSGKAPGASLLGVPVLAVETKLWHLLGWPSPSKRAAVLALRLFATALPICLFLALFARDVERRTRSPALRDLAVLGLGLGTMLYPYGVLFVGHGLAAALSCGAFMLLVPQPAPAPASAEGGRPSAAACAGAGLLAGLGVMFEYQNLIPAALLLVFAAARGGPRAAVAFVAGAAPAAVALGVYHAICFGRPWSFPYGHLENAEFQTVYHARGYHGLSLPQPGVVGSILFAMNYGLFALSPFLLLGLAAAARALALRPRREGALILALVAGMVLFLAGVGNWRGGWTVGPRYIVVLAPLLALAPGIGLGRRAAWLVSSPPSSPSPSSGLSWSALARSALFGAVVGLVLVSVVLNGLAGALYPHFPPQLRNPVFQLLVPLLADGYVPYSAGWLAGLPGLWSLAPLAAVVVAAVVLVIAGAGPGFWRRSLAAAVALGLAAWMLGAYGRYARHPNVTEQAATAFVRTIWEPPVGRQEPGKEPRQESR